MAEKKCAQAKEEKALRLFGLAWAANSAWDLLNLQEAISHRAENQSARYAPRRCIGTAEQDGDHGKQGYRRHLGQDTILWRSIVVQQHKIVPDTDDD